MMRVLFLQHGLGYGGATKSLFVMQKSLHHQVEIFTLVKTNKKLNRIIGKELIYSNPFIEVDIKGVYSYSEGTISFRDFKKSLNYYPGPIIDYINQNKIDVLHINSSVFSNLLKPIKEKTNCKIVIHFREMLPYGKTHPIDAYILENSLKYADKLIAISPNELRFFPENKKIEILSNPHDFEMTDQLLLKEKTQREQIVVGMCANFSPVKGHLVFINAINLVNKQLNGQDVEFRIIGYPNEKKSLKLLLKGLVSRGYKRKVDSLIKRLDIKNLRLVPFTFNVLPEISELDIYVRPDLSGNPWGRDVIEAMALKKPVIATGSSDFYIVDHQNGFLIQSNNAEQLASKILMLLNDQALTRSLGERGYLDVKEKCCLNSYGKKLISIYENIV